MSVPANAHMTVSILWLDATGILDDSHTTLDLRDDVL